MIQVQGWWHSSATSDTSAWCRDLYSLSRRERWQIIWIIFWLHLELAYDVGQKFSKLDSRIVRPWPHSHEHTQTRQGRDFTRTRFSRRHNNIIQSSYLRRKWLGRENEVVEQRSTGITDHTPAVVSRRIEPLSPSPRWNRSVLLSWWLLPCCHVLGGRVFETWACRPSFYPSCQVCVSRSERT